MMTSHSSQMLSVTENLSFLLGPLQASAGDPPSAILKSTGLFSVGVGLHETRAVRVVTF